MRGGMTSTCETFTCTRAGNDPPDGVGDVSGRSGQGRVLGRAYRSAIRRPETDIENSDSSKPLDVGHANAGPVQVAAQAP